MPYIKKIDRDDFSRTLDPLLWRVKEGVEPGEINYLITQIMIASLGGNIPHGDITYRDLHDAYGAAMGAATEFYRRMLAPHETNAAFRNGDVYAEIRERHATQLNAAYQKEKERDGQGTKRS